MTNGNKDIQKWLQRAAELFGLGLQQAPDGCYMYVQRLNLSMANFTELQTAAGYRKTFKY